MPKEFTKELAGYAVHLDFDDLPGEVVDQARFALLDALGSAIGCVKVGDESAKIVTDLMAKWGGREEATVVGREKRIPSANAALANGSLTKGLGFDFHLDSAIHVNNILIPAALAAAELAGAGGKELLCAIVAGYEVMTRVGMAVPRITDRGFDGTGLCGVFGCAAAAGRLLDLGKKEMVHAFGVAAVQGSGMANYKGHMAAYLQMVKAAQNGVLAASLAKEGFTGLDTILEDQMGFCTIYPDHPNFEMLTRGLGETYEIMRTSFKAYSCEIYLHPGVQALLSIMDSNSIVHNDVKKITLKIPSSIISISGSREFPRTRFGARVNGRYIMAATAIFGEDIAFNVKPFQEQTRRDDKIRRLAQKVEVVGSRKLEKGTPADWACEVEVLTNDGRRFECRNDAPRGHFRRPLTRTDHEAKFTRLASHTLKQKRIDRIIETIWKLEKMSDVTSLMDIVNTPVLSA